MAELVYEAARKQAQNYLDAYWDGLLPVKLAPITQALDASKVESDMLGSVSGLVIKDAGQPPRILLNSGESAQRRRFTWAHELGHVIERASVANDDEYSFSDARGKKYDLHEFYADEFAGALLMPLSELQRMQKCGRSIPEMANEFGVSVPAVQHRLKRLAKHPG